MSDHALVIGEALVDVVVSTDGSVAAHPGGSPANVAIGLGRLGREVELLAYLADDDNGALVREHLAASQVSLAVGSLGGTLDLRGDRAPRRHGCGQLRI